MENNWTTAIMAADTTKMSNEDWTIMRAQPDRLGGSDQAIIMGCSPWTTAQQLADEKMGLVEHENLSKDALTTGHIFEPFVAMNFVRYMKREFPGLKIRLIKDFFRDMMEYAKCMFGENKIFDKCMDGLSKIYDLNMKAWGINPNGYYQCGQRNEDGTLKYPFAFANLDGIVEVTDKSGIMRRGIFEAKTTNYSTNRKTVDKYWKKGICPPYYYYQVLFYMEVMELDFCYITCCWGLTLDNMAVILIERDKIAGKLLMETDAEFLRRVELGLDVEDFDKNQSLLEKYYYKKYGVPKENKDTPIELPLSFAPLIDEAVALDDEISLLEEELSKKISEKAGICNKFYPYLKDNSYATLTNEDGEKKGFALVVPHTSPRFNQEAFKKDHPLEYREILEKGKGKWAIANLRKLYPQYEGKYTPVPVVDESKPLNFRIYDYEKKEETV